MEIKTRKQAKIDGDKSYYTGKPCVNGHVSKRVTVNGSCVECNIKRTKEWRNDCSERIQQYNKEYKARYRKECADKLRELKSQYYYRNKDSIVLKQMAYVKENKELVYARGHNRRAKLRGDESKFTKEDIKRILAQQKGVCAYCRTKLKQYHIDHIVPVARGGTNKPRNLQLLCQTCNCRKSAKDPLVWARQIGLLL